MDLINNLSVGFTAVFALEAITIFGITLQIPMNIVYVMVGCVVGTLVGVLPGLGPLATIAMLLPATYALPPLGGLIMLAGIYYGSQYGGSTTAILVGLPGEVSSVVTILDGRQMAKNGRAGVALSTAAIGSFFAGCVGTLLLAAAAPSLAEIAFKFGPAEYFSLMVLGLLGAVVLASGSILKAVGMVMLGLLMGLVGTDVNSGVQRYAFNIPELSDGLQLVGLAMGVFGFAEVMTNVEKKDNREIYTDKITTLYPSWDDIKRMTFPILRGSALGAVVGILPGAGAAIASFGSYALEKKVAKDPSIFGKGAIEGVAGPEAANNAAAQCNFIPLLTLGIPGSAVMALMIGAMTIHNIQPGPQVMTSNPSLFWGLVCSMWLGNLALVILNLPMVGIWVKLLKVPYRMLYPAILTFCVIGVYSTNNNVFDVYTTAAFGVMGYAFFKLGMEGAPLLLGFVLGPMMEENFRRTLLLSRGDFTVLVTRPLSASLLAIALLLLIVMSLPALQAKREILKDDM